MDGRWIAAGLLVAYLLGRRRRPVAYAPPPAWGAPPARRPVSAKGVLVLAVIVAGVLVGAGIKVPAQGSSGGPNLAGIFGGFQLPQLDQAKPSAKAGSAVKFALAQRGKPYRWGARGPGAYDCSGLMWRAWQHAGVSIPRTAAGQLKGLRRVGKVQPGDLVIYHSSASRSRRHVAMVVGGGRMVEARSRRSGVVVSRLRGGWLGAVRPGVR
jgi:hypothetical protein